jgi:hypothetical protein
VVQVSDEIEDRKKAAEKGWIGQPQPERPGQFGIIARKALKYFRAKSYPVDPRP